MAKVYLAVNGDKVGSKISETIMSNDPEAVREMSAKFNQSHAEIDQWVEKNGGRVISASGDEALYEIEDSKLSEVERLMSNYESKTGHTMTAGVGNDLMEAVKAMVYGKMHDPGQLIQYDAEVDEAISPKEEAQAEEIAGDMGEEEDSSDEMEEMSDDGMIQESDMESQEMDEEDDLPEDDMEETEEMSDDMENSEENDLSEDDMSEEDEMEEMPEDEESEEDTVTMPKDDFVDEHEDLVDTLESPEHEDDMEEAEEQEDELEEVEGQEGDVDMSEEDGEMGNMEEMQEDDMEDGEQEIPELSDEDVEMQEDDMQDMEEESPEDMEEEGQDSPVLDMVHANMEEEQPEMEGMPEEGEQDSQALKQKVMQTLMSFKQNKQKIEMMKEADPEMYQSTIEMLNRMIEMAKQLGANPEMQEMQPEMDGEMEEQVEEEQDPSMEGSEIKKPMGGM